MPWKKLLAPRIVQRGYRVVGVAERRLVLIAVPELVAVALVVVTGIPPCMPAGILEPAGLFLLLGGLGLGPWALYSSVERASFRLSSGMLVAEAPGWRVEVPLGSVEEVELLEHVRPVARLMGAALPGLYLGYFKLRGLGRAILFLDRLDNVVLVRAGGEALLFSPRRPGELLGMLRGAAGRGLAGRPRILDRSRRLLAASMLAVLVLLAAGLALYAELPERVPLHYGPGFKPDRWGSRTEILAMLGVVDGIALLLSALGLLLGRRSPGLGYMLAPASLGLGLLALSMVTAPLCFL